MYMNLMEQILLLKVVTLGFKIENDHYSRKTILTHFENIND